MSIPDLEPAAQAGANILKTGINYKLYVVIGLVIGVGLFSAWFLKLEPIHSWIDPAMAPLSAIAAALIVDAQGMFESFMKYLAANPIAGVLGIVTAFGTLYGVVSAVSAQRAKANAEALATEKIHEAQQSLVDTSQKYAQTTRELSEAKDKIASYENDPSLQEAQIMVSDLNQKVRMQADTISELEKVIQDMKLKEKTIIA